MNKSYEHDKGSGKPANEMNFEQTYNVVSDTVTGVNFRLKDNLIQLLIVIIFTALGALSGVLFFDIFNIANRLIFGGLAGLIVGWILSGAGIMIYRAVLHAQGRHN